MMSLQIIQCRFWVAYEMMVWFGAIKTNRFFSRSAYACILHIILYIWVNACVVSCFVIWHLMYYTYMMQSHAAISVSIVASAKRVLNIHNFPAPAVHHCLRSRFVAFGLISFIYIQRHQETRHLTRATSSEHLNRQCAADGCVWCVAFSYDEWYSGCLV